MSSSLLCCCCPFPGVSGRIIPNNPRLFSNQNPFTTRNLKGTRKVLKTRRFRPVKASLFGVGAPEVFVIAVVSLLVFGPKGLAEVARSLGKTLREFQPTIKEIQDVSKEFKQALEKEIGLDEIPPQTSSIYRQAPQENNGEPAEGQEEEAKPYSAEDYLKVTDEQVRALVSEQDRKAAEAQAWGGTVPVKPASQEPTLTTTSQVEKSNQDPEDKN